MRCKRILFLIGIFVFLYPSISGWWNSFHQSLVISRYGERIGQIDQDTYGEWKEEAVLYNKKIEKKFMGAMSEKEKAEYESVFDIYEDGLIGYIEIPAIDVKLPFYHGTDESVLQIGAGHMEGTSFPVGSVNSHCILSGHRGLPSAKLFTDLNHLKKGDIFRICILNEKYYYGIYEIRTVLPEETNLLQIEKGKDLCTLVTCTPYGINSHRLLVCGIRVEKGEEMEQIEERFNDHQIDRNETMERKGKNAAKWFVLCLLVVFFFLSSKGEVRAEEKTDFLEESMAADEKTYDLEIQYKFPGVIFSLCKIEGEYDMDYLKPEKSGKTDWKGQILFEDLPKGRYVVWGEEHREKESRYMPVVAEISVPVENGVGTGKIRITPKYETIPEETTTEEHLDLEKVLPQTGQSWRLVLVLTFLGAFLLILAGLNGFKD
ncbi:MAG: class C sortase [Lachnospiraceae bacterium]|nr:class C sortase [Lachnospiraceae bacterium]